MSQRVKIPKAKGNCSHCLTSIKLHQKDGLVHLHGPRDDRCPGSNRPPLDTRDVGGTSQGVSGTVADLANDVPIGTSQIVSQSVANVESRCSFSHPVARGPLL